MLEGRTNRVRNLEKHNGIAANPALSAEVAEVLGNLGAKGIHVNKVDEGFVLQLMVATYGLEFLHQ